MAVMAARRGAIALRRAALRWRCQAPRPATARRWRRRRATGAVLAAEIGACGAAARRRCPRDRRRAGRGAEATRETVEVAVAGYRATPTRETALLNLLLVRR